MSRPETATSRITAAFVILFETFINCQRSHKWEDLEPDIAALRRAIPLSREEAQYMLQTGITDVVTPAFVLAYEGVSQDRVESDFTFSYEDLTRLAEARAKVRMSLRRALAEFTMSATNTTS